MAGAQPPSKRRLQAILKLSGLILGSVGASAVLAAVVSGLFALHQDDREFLRDQRVTAYSHFIDQLLAFEETYEAGRRLLEPLTEEGPLQGSSTDSPSDLSNKLGARLDSIRLAKASVDILGTPETTEQARKAIELYGPYKGQMQDDLRILQLDMENHKDKTQPLKRTMLRHKDHARKNLDMQKCAREPFSDQARRDLDVEVKSSEPFECLQHPNPQPSP